MASKCINCHSEDGYNFELNIGLCNSCIGEQLDELEAEIKDLKTRITLALEYLPKSPDKAIHFLTPALKGG